MGIKEKLQHILNDRARQEAEAARRGDEARELERIRRQAEEARKNAEIQRVKGILDSKGIPQMLERDVIPLLRKIGSTEVGLSEVGEADITISRGRQFERMKAIGLAIYADGPEEWRHKFGKYDHAQLGVFIEPDTGKAHLCTYGSNFSRARFSLNDRNLKDKLESELAKILSEPGTFSWDEPDNSRDFDLAGR